MKETETDFDVIFYLLEMVLTLRSPFQIPEGKLRGILPSTNKKILTRTRRSKYFLDLVVTMFTFIVCCCGYKSS